MITSTARQTMPYDPPTLGSPYRILLLGAATTGWYQAPDAEHRDRLLTRFREWFDSWTERGARLLVSFDDDLFMVGPPIPQPASLYVVYEIDDLGLVVDRLAALRDEVDGIRLDSAFRMEARVGRRLFLLPG